MYMRSERFTGTIPGVCGAERRVHGHIGSRKPLPKPLEGPKRPTRPIRVQDEPRRFFELFTNRTCDLPPMPPRRRPAEPASTPTLSVGFSCTSPWGRGTPHLSYGGRAAPGATPFRVLPTPA